MVTSSIRFVSLLLTSLLVGTMFGIWLGFLRCSRRPRTLRCSRARSARQHSYQLSASSAFFSPPPGRANQHDKRGVISHRGGDVPVILLVTRWQSANQRCRMTWSPQNGHNWMELVSGGTGISCALWLESVR